MREAGRPNATGQGWRRRERPASLWATTAMAYYLKPRTVPLTKSAPGLFKVPRRWGMPAGESPWASARARYSTPAPNHLDRSRTVPKCSPAGRRRGFSRRCTVRHRLTCRWPGSVAGDRVARRSAPLRWPARGHGGHVGGWA